MYDGLDFIYFEHMGCGRSRILGILYLVIFWCCLKYYLKSLIVYFDLHILELKVEVFNIFFDRIDNPFQLKYK